ncbi:MAG: endonuclease [Tenericutes bacterium]|nr:endonuclease [Mycoplasmatota bacterium]
MASRLRKIIALLLIVIVTISIVSCDKTGTTTATEVTTQQETTLPASTTNTVTVPTSTTYISTTFEITTTREIIVYTGIEVTKQYTRFFEIDEAFDNSSFELVAHLSDGSQEVISSELIRVRGYDSSTAGVKNLFVTFDRFIVELSVIVLNDYAFEIDMEYYEDAINLKGTYLKTILNNIINEGFNPLLYGQARDILQESDEDPSNPDNIMLVYTGYSVVSTWDVGVTWNREHVWPQSRLGVSVGYPDDFASMATDIHNLKPSDPDENASRSNDYFNTIVGSDFYEPRDEVKGDIARILFYMTTMYPSLTLNNDETTSSAYLTMGTLSVLLEWNLLDPVDEFEMNRNNVLYSYQGNRNPYIDYPGFADLIWGDIA